MIYLDYAAATPVHPEVLQTYTGLLQQYYGNPDSNHPIGVEVNRLLTQSRELIAGLLHCKSNEILFTSGASESNNLAIKGIALQYQHRGKHIITSNSEHATIMEACRQLEELFGFTITYLPVNEQGCISLAQVQAALRPDTILVSLIYINNELGSINPIQEIGLWLQAQTKVIFHSDLVQAVGKYALPTAIDLATISAHKIHGIKGSGILIKKDPLVLSPIISGGDQEFGYRAGTNNAPLNIVFAKTLRLAMQDQTKNTKVVEQLRDLLVERLLQIPGIVMNSSGLASAYIVNFQTTLPSEIMMNALSNAGFCVSAKSTCATRFAKPSHVLIAAGLSKEQALHSIRVSLDHEVTPSELHDFADHIKDILLRFRT